MDYSNIPNATYCHPEVASVGLTEQQCKDKKLDYKVGQVPLLGERPRAHVGRDGRLRQDHSRREVRRDPRRAHRRRARHGADPRARRRAHERVHRRRSRSGDPRAPDVVRGDRRSGARFAGEDDPRVSAVAPERGVTRRELWVERLGVVPYAQALDFQRQVARARISGASREDVLLLVEHPPVVTLGRSAKAAASARVAGAARGARRRAVRGRARRRRHLSRPRPARRLSDHRPQAAQAGSALVSAPGRGSADRRARRARHPAGAERRAHRRVDATGGRSRRSACMRATG